MFSLLVSFALAADPSDAEALVTRAKTALAAGDTAQAEQLIIELFQFFPDSEAAKRVVKSGLSGTSSARNPEDEAAAAAMAADLKDALAAGELAEARGIATELRSRFPDTSAGKSAAKTLTELEVVGKRAPALLVDRWFQGEASFTTSGATLVVFWETWCPHCNKEAEHIEELANTWVEGLTVVGLTKITKSSSDEKVRAFIAEHGWTFAVGKEDDGSMSKAFAVTGIPAAAIVKDGVVVWRGHPARLTDELVGKLLR